MIEVSGRKRYDDEPFNRDDFWHLCCESTLYRMAYLIDGGFNSVLTQKKVKKLDEAAPIYATPRDTLRTMLVDARDLLVQKAEIRLTDENLFNPSDHGLLLVRTAFPLHDAVEETFGETSPENNVKYVFMTMDELHRRDRSKYALSIDVSEGGKDYDTFVSSPQRIVNKLLPLGLCYPADMQPYLAVLASIMFRSDAPNIFDCTTGHGIIINPIYVKEMIAFRNEYYKAHGLASQNDLKNHIEHLAETDEVLAAVPGFKATYEKLLARRIEDYEMTTIDYITQSVWKAVDIMEDRLQSYTEYLDKEKKI